MLWEDENTNVLGTDSSSKKGHLQRQYLISTVFLAALEKLMKDGHLDWM